MASAPNATSREAEHKAAEESPDYDRQAMTPFTTYPLPGIIDFIGACVGGELAEERWR